MKTDYINHTIPRFQPECFSCRVRRGYEAVRTASNDREFQLKVLKQLTNRLMAIPLNGIVDAGFSEWFFQIIREATGERDIFSLAKLEFNRQAKALYPSLKHQLMQSKDRLLTALLISAAGNIFDEVHGLGFDLGKSVNSAIEKGFKYTDYQSFRKSLSASKQILFITDNAGEIVFDRLLLEELNHSHITCVVKGAPVSTDAMVDDAKFADIEQVAQVIATEADHPTRIVGSGIEALSRALDEADMIISKGNLNHEMLTSQLQKRAFYIFKIKCNTIRESLLSKSNFELGDVVLIEQ